MVVKLALLVEEGVTVFFGVEDDEEEQEGMETFELLPKDDDCCCCISNAAIESSREGVAIVAIMGATAAPFITVVSRVVNPVNGLTE